MFTSTNHPNNSNIQAMATRNSKWLVVHADVVIVMPGLMTILTLVLLNCLFPFSFI